MRLFYDFFKKPIDILHNIRYNAFSTLHRRESIALSLDNRYLMGPITAPGVGDPTTDLRIEWHVIDGKLPVVLHWHTYCEFEFILGGSGTHQLNNASLPLGRGSAYLCMTNDFHKIKETPSDPLTIVNVKFHESLINKSILSKLEKLFMHRYCVFESDEDILRLSYLLDMLKSIQASEYNSRSVKKVLIECTLNQILSLFVLHCLEHQNETVDPLKNEHKIQKAIAYIHKNFTSDISQNDVAEHIGLSVNYFSAYFKELMNCSYSSYLLNLRLNYARSLIMSNHIYSVNAITEMVGFSSVSYFIKVFKKRFGITPKEMIHKVRTDTH